MPHGRLVVAALLACAVLAGCAGPAAPADAPGGLAVDAADRPYCDAVTRLQQEQSAPQNSVQAASEADRRRTAEVAALAPPELTGPWRTLRELTDQAASALTAAGDDPNRVDRTALARLGQSAQPAVEQIRAVTLERCGVAFRPSA